MEFAQIVNHQAALTGNAVEVEVSGPHCRRRPIFGAGLRSLPRGSLGPLPTCLLQKSLATPGFDIDAVDDKGRTMLLLAVIGGHAEIVKKARACSRNLMTLVVALLPASVARGGASALRNRGPIAV